MANPKKSIPWGNSIIVCLEEYDKYHIPDPFDDFIQKFELFDDRLNYPKKHENKEVFESYLKQIGLRAEEVKIPKRWAAVKAGLGKFRNNNFIYGNHGSWVTIDTWIVDKELIYEKTLNNIRCICPANCNLCIKACPTGALSAPMQMDVTRCNAYLTYKSVSASGNKLNYSQCICDICQSVCPVNNKNETKSFKESLLLEKLFNLDCIFTMDESTFFKLLQPYYDNIDKDSFSIWKCNIIKSMVTNKAKNYVKYFLLALNDSDKNVRETAKLALDVKV
ncbi:epoxyqueuosine reductase [Anaeromicropila herbilytica]|uniref:Fe-S oxidoreductase n=1 Tax=Anaeromicropila herbilytica TaxID=2785025 RepID=A0A7R7IE93_9FIRM|nr:4Fe-4S double cluster binding domain-containing protein [Anaeromicropila herbilytica]BCN31746.1 Fe-S oxidoreductase [Anaeromicropila herbilytica]